VPLRKMREVGRLSSGCLAQAAEEDEAGVPVEQKRAA
jgi:hypothetical protein